MCYIILLGILRMFWRLIWAYTLILITFRILWYATGDRLKPRSVNFSRSKQVAGDCRVYLQTGITKIPGAKNGQGEVTIYIEVFSNGC